MKAMNQLVITKDNPEHLKSILGNLRKIRRVKNIDKLSLQTVEKFFGVVEGYLDAIPGDETGQTDADVTLNSSQLDDTIRFDDAGNTSKRKRTLYSFSENTLTDQVSYLETAKKKQRKWNWRKVI